jgi:hypothetical protein
MLTLVEAISLGGDRAKQNDDAQGYAHDAAWVIDGATDLHNTPLTGWPSDAAWIAHTANQIFYAGAGENEPEGLRALIAHASTEAGREFTRLAGAPPSEKWKMPICSLLMAAETEAGIAGLDLGDCRCFALDSEGQAQMIGGPEEIADTETRLAADAAKAAGGTTLLRHEGTMDLLRRLRDGQNSQGSSWTFCLDPNCANEARTWEMRLERPAHVLLATDGFASLVDRYGVYDGAGLVRAAREKGLQELGRELRAIETADAAGSRHPRFKPSDDATALLLRLK